MGDGRLQIARQQGTQAQDPTHENLPRMDFHGFAQLSAAKD
jgi:hypothetical protein